MILCSKFFSFNGWISEIQTRNVINIQVDESTIDYEYIIVGKAIVNLTLVVLCWLHVLSNL